METKLNTKCHFTERGTYFAAKEKQFRTNQKLFCEIRNGTEREETSIFAVKDTGSDVYTTCAGNVYILLVESTLLIIVVVFEDSNLRISSRSNQYIWQQGELKYKGAIAVFTVTRHGCMFKWIELS